MRKLSAIWRILWADEFAVFTLQDCKSRPGWLGAPNFFWIISHEDSTFFWYIKERMKTILEKKPLNIHDLWRKSM
nr:MAG TPA: hypothetical protein [Caudoviricetes sp.]